MIGSCHADRMTVLLVEDEPAVAEMLADLLVEAGYIVEHAACGRGALAHVLRRPPDLLLLDLGLPDLGGLEVCRLARRHAPDAAIVALSARAGTGDAVAALDAGADDYVRKPVEPDELLARVGAILRAGERARRYEAG